MTVKEVFSKIKLNKNKQYPFEVPNPKEYRSDDESFWVLLYPQDGRRWQFHKVEYGKKPGQGTFVFFFDGGTYGFEDHEILPRETIKVIFNEL